MPPDTGDRRSLNARHRATYDQVAARYAVVNAAMPAVVAAAATRFVKLFDGSGRLLELGCGHGRDVAWFEAQGINVVGADLSPGMLREAVSRVAAPLVEVDMRYLAFGAGSFEAVWCNAAMIHLPAAELPGVLAEVRRVLVPGGWLYAATQVGSGEVWEAQSYGLPAPRFFVRYAQDAFGDLLTRAGFDVVERDGNPGGPNRQWEHYFARVRPTARCRDG